MALEFIIHAMYGTGRRYTATAPRQINRGFQGGQHWGKTYPLNWPYVQYSQKFKIIGEHSAYALYRARCEAENLNAHDKHMWLVHGRPTGPI